LFVGITTAGLSPHKIASNLLERLRKNYITVNNSSSSDILTHTGISGTTALLLLSGTAALIRCYLGFVFTAVRASNEVNTPEIRVLPFVDAIGLPVVQSGPWLLGGLRITGK